MNSKTTISISEARKRIFKIAEEVQMPDIQYTLTENGRAKMVVMSADEFDSWRETMEIIANPRLMKEIRSAREDFEKGDYIALEKFLDNEKHASRTSQKRRTKKS